METVRREPDALLGGAGGGAAAGEMSRSSLGFPGEALPGGGEAVLILVAAEGDAVAGVVAVGKRPGVGLGSGISGGEAVGGVEEGEASGGGGVGRVEEHSAGVDGGEGGSGEDSGPVAAADAYAPEAVA